MYSNLRGQSRGAASSRSGHFLYHCVLEIFAIVPIHLFQILCRPFRAVGVPPTAFRLLHATSFLTQGADIEEIPETIVADERKLKQIVFNLLSNAVKFTPQQGTVHIEGFRLPLATAHSLGHARRSISAQEAEYLSTVETGDSIVISVQDSGIGMRQEDLKRIFNAFDQVENSKSRQYSGTGLGLSLTKQLVELHNGRIWAESEGVGKGSRFRVIIPCRL